MDARVSISFSCKAVLSRFARVWIPRAVKGSRIPTTVRPTAVVSRTLFAVSNGSFERCLERSSSTQAAMWMTPRKRRMAKSTSNARRCGSTCHHNGLRTDTSSTTKDDGTLPPGDGGGTPARRRATRAARGGAGAHRRRRRHPRVALLTFLWVPVHDQ